ncbi:hypothetical protein RSOL_393310, partial [Rhizoctonia solani AG-3 Rhs1AP]
MEKPPVLAEVESNKDYDDNFKAQFTMIEDKVEGDHNMWELRMVGAPGSKLLHMKYGNEANYGIEVGDLLIDIIIEAHHGCSFVGMQIKANTECKKIGMDLILIVEKTAVATVRERVNLPLNTCITQMERENAALRTQLRDLTKRLENLEKGIKGEMNKKKKGTTKDATEKQVDKTDIEKINEIIERNTVFLSVT